MLNQNKENKYTHIYLYAKGWYEHGDLLKDLKRIVSYTTGISYKYVVNEDVFSMLSGCCAEALEHNNKSCSNLLWKSLHFLTNQDLVDVLINEMLLDIASVKVAGLNIGNPSPDCLPLVEHNEQ